MFIEFGGGRLGPALPLQEMSRKSLISLRFKPEIHLQSGKQYFVTMATELLKKRMSSNMRILVLMATAIAAYFWEKMCLAFFLPVSWEGEGEVSSTRCPPRFEVLTITGSEAGPFPQVKAALFYKVT